MRALDLTPHALRAALKPGHADTADGPTAAVAAIFRTGDHGTELLFIQRASKDSDPWSGHMAFPGGRTDVTDRDSHHTAERETLEEVALDLSGALRLGSLDELRPGRQRGSLEAIYCHAYWLDGPRPELQENYEVAATVWVPLGELTNTERFIEYYYAQSDSTWPGIQLDDPAQVVWGLTLRFLAGLFARLDLDFIEIRPYDD